MRLGPYELEAEIGRGGLGVVLRARAPDGRRVAIKFVRSADGEALARFEREQRLAEGLGAGFVPVIDRGTSRELGPFFVMPLLEGGTLRDRLDKTGALPPPDARALGVKLARALGAAHARGIVHRDLKPENVLFTNEGEPLIADLGLARHYDRTVDGASASVSLSKSEAFLGTASYMAPEQLADARRAIPASDVFALGAILYECLSGEPPFTGETVVEVLTRIVEGRFEPLDVPDAPKQLVEAIHRALAHEPGERFEHGAAFARALRRGEESAPWRAIAAGVFGAVLISTPLIAGLGAGRAAPPPSAL